MLVWLKKHFIPHAGNDHRPHILREYSVRAVIGIVIFLELIIFLIPTFSKINMTGGLAAVLPGVLSLLANEERLEQNLPALSISEALNRAAGMKAQDMAAKSYFAHTSPEGKTPWHWLEQVGYEYQYAGENLAINFRDSKDVVEAWMKSPTHRANVVKGNYTEVGTGIAIGFYKGREAIFVAQIYANPVKIARADMGAKKADAVSSENSKTAENILGVETAVSGSQPDNNPAFWQKALASPRNSFNMILLAVSAMTAAALFIYLFAKTKRYHLDLITNGMVILAILGTIFAANYYLSYKDAVIAQSFDYANEN